MTGQYVSGASTLTQQLAGRLYADRSDISIRRKLVELWWAIQMERRYTKQEILQMYLNEMPFGHNTQGVQAASKFFFKHPVQEDTLAESVMLVIQLAKPGLYSPFKNPQRARKLQRHVLDQMVGLGYVTKKEADSSFDEYWSKYDYTRGNSTAYFEREDKAPWFSEYIRNQLDELLFGSYDVLTDGLVVHTTLNLDYQSIAEDRMKKDLEEVNNRYLALSNSRINFSNAQFLPMIDMLGLGFNIDDLMYRNRNASGNAKRLYAKSITPVVELLTSLFSMNRPQDIVAAGNEASLNVTRRTQVEGALVSIDPSNGYILAMVGGKEFGVDQFNRATMAKVEPGSAFKPLYYSAAIDSRKFTPATMILDAPVVFTNPDGTLYEPLNYKGEWHGRVLMRDALAESMNVPSLKILDGIGFDAAIQRASRMLGITDPAEIEKTFPRYYPLGLGVITVSPLQMARAFSTFPNGGREVVPVAIRYIEDRNGKIILEPAKEIMAQESRKGDSAQIMSPQTAYIMTSMLQSTIKEGTLGGVASLLDIWNDKSQPFAGKTGTTQNWSDAWTVGFSPYMTTAVWYGFDQGNRSLGTELTGAAIAGPHLGEVHEGRPQEPPGQALRPAGERPGERGGQRDLGPAAHRVYEEDHQGDLPCRHGAQGVRRDRRIQCEPRRNDRGQPEEVSHQFEHRRRGYNRCPRLTCRRPTRAPPPRARATPFWTEARNGARRHAVVHQGPHVGRRQRGQGPGAGYQTLRRKSSGRSPTWSFPRWGDGCSVARSDVRWTP